MLWHQYLPPPFGRVLGSACSKEQGPVEDVLSVPRAWSSEQGRRLLYTRVLLLLHLCRPVFGPGQVLQAPREAVLNLVSLHSDGVRIRGGSLICCCHKLLSYSLILVVRDCCATSN